MLRKRLARSKDAIPPHRKQWGILASFRELMHSLNIDGGSMSTAGEVMQYEVLVEHDVKVAMRDWIKLACAVYRPAHAGQAVTGTFPVILECTP